ncbi:MAG: hypothetical protein DRQ24_12030 [Candidatus Latescibacterota bacterium]|nr:MAG: hypothetical protein DRQ24_12030 [Candidatus Latescibacterota bacterium]
MKLSKKIEEKDLIQYFPEIQKLIEEWKKKYSILPEEDLSSIPTEDIYPSITQPSYTYQIHSVA